jgi:hypothetical protein
MASPWFAAGILQRRAGDGSAMIDSLAKQEAQTIDLVDTCETRADAFRYAWLTGRVNNGDPDFASLLAPGAGRLADLGKLYLALPFSGG